MKTTMTAAPWALCFSLVCGGSLTSQSQSQESTDFAYSVPFELGDTEFAPGDSIRIQSVKGTQSGFAVGGSYSVTGEYTLTSKPEAELSLFVTTTDATPTEVQPSQTVRVKKGKGPFTLVKTLSQPGYPHLTFYPTSGGSGFGGVYFGQGDWVLRQKRFSYFDSRPGASASPSATESAARLEGAQNQAIYEYLGSPVVSPANLDKSYTKEGLLSSMRLAAQKAGVTAKRIEIDDSEFPFLVGMITAEGAFDKILEQIRQMKAYEHQGGVSTSTCRAINIIPWRVYPSESAQRIARRLTVREHMFFDKLSQIESSL